MNKIYEDPWIQRSMMGDELVEGWPKVEEYVINNDGEEFEYEVIVDSNDQHNWNSNGTRILVVN
jgi:hypothetical protein